MKIDLNLPETREELLIGGPTKLYDIVAEFFTVLEKKYGSDVLYDAKEAIDEFFDYDGPTGVNRMVADGNLNKAEYAAAFKDTLRQHNNKTDKIEFTEPEEALEEDEDSPYYG